MPRASGLAAKIAEKIGVDTELIRGGGGVFDVNVDGKLIFSKHQTGRFPDDREVLDQLPG